MDSSRCGHDTDVRVLLGILCVLLACGADHGDGAAPGEELGPCVQDQFCVAGLVCADGVCVDPGQIDDGGGPTGVPTSDPSDDEGPLTGDPVTTGDEDAPIIHCTADVDTCICGHDEQFGTPGASCNSNTVAAPAMCCAAPEWPYGGLCSCWTLSCRQLSGDTCYCGLGAADGEPEVEHCTAGSGICCLNPGASCTCYSEDFGGCGEGESVVDACYPEVGGCSGASAVTNCT